MDDGERESGGRERGRRRPRRLPHEPEEERERGRHHQLPRSRGRQGDRRVGPAVTGREADEGDLREQDRRASPDGSEDGHAGLEDDEERHRDEHARLVQEHRGRIDAAHAPDEREQHVPEREGVAGMQSPVRELVHRPQVQVAEGVELAHAGEVEERVAVERAGHVPERDPEEHAGPRDRPGRPRHHGSLSPGERKRQGGKADGPVQGEGEPERAMDHEHHPARAEQAGEAPRQGRRQARPAQRAGDE
jgi:hypothetical protein